MKWMKFSKYMESQYLGTDWMKADEEYCDEDGLLDEEMNVDAWLTEDERGGGFLHPVEEETKDECDDYYEEYYEEGPLWNDNYY